MGCKNCCSQLFCIINMLPQSWYLANGHVMKWMHMKWVMNNCITKVWQLITKSVFSLWGVWKFIHEYSKRWARAKTSIPTLTALNQFPLYMYLPFTWPVSFPVMKTSVTVHTTDLEYATTYCKNNLIWHVVKYKRSVTACGWYSEVWVESMPGAQMKRATFGKSGFEVTEEG